MGWDEDEDKDKDEDEDEDEDEDADEEKDENSSMSSSMSGSDDPVSDQTTVDFSLKDGQGTLMDSSSDSDQEPFDGPYESVPLCCEGAVEVTEEAREFHRLSLEYGLPRAARRALLKLVHAPWFKRRLLPKSVETADAAGEAMYPSLPSHLFTMKDGKEITYTLFLDIVEDMLKHATDLDGMQWAYNFAGVYGHPCTTLRCKEMQRCMHKAAAMCLPRRRRADCRLLLPIFYFDGVETRRLRGQQNNAIYFTLGNVSTTEHLSSAGKWCLAIVPEGADILEALEVVIIRHLRRLEDGIPLWFAAVKRSYFCYGSAFAILGDHPALAKAAGTGGNMAFYCCRYCHGHKQFFFVPSTGWPHPHKGGEVLAPLIRGCYKTVYEKHADATTADLQENGWAKEPSPFWKLEWMHKHHYQCFGMCFLHLHLLGLAKTHLTYMAIKLGQQKMAILEERLLQHQAFVGSKKLYRIFVKPSGKRSRSVNLAPLVGDQMETILQIMEECLIGLVPDEDRACWRAHVDMVELLRQPSFTEADLDSLEKAINSFKTCFYQLFVNVRDCFTTRSNKVTTTLKKPLSFEFPNLGALEHWPEQIRYLGAPCFQSTKVWEHRHLDSKRCSTNTNQKEFERDIMLRMAKIQRIRDVDIFEKRRQPPSDGGLPFSDLYSATGKGIHATVDETEQWPLLQAAVNGHGLLGDNIVPAEARLRAHAGLHYFRHKIKPGHFILLRVPPHPRTAPPGYCGKAWLADLDKLGITTIADGSIFSTPSASTQSLSSHVVVARLLRVLTVRLPLTHDPLAGPRRKRKSTHTVLELEVFVNLPVRVDNFVRLRSTHRACYVSPSPDGWSIARVLPVFPQPQQLNTYLLNHRVCRTWTDQRATEESDAIAGADDNDDDDDYAGRAEWADDAQAEEWAECNV